MKTLQTYKFWFYFCLVCFTFFLGAYCFQKFGQFDKFERRSWILVTTDEIITDVSSRNKYDFEHVWCFDYDDTLMFTSYAFEVWRRTNNQTDLSIVREETKDSEDSANVSIPCTSVVPVVASRSVDMWDFVNGPGLALNVPKFASIKLLRHMMLNMHNVRIVIITSRCSSSVDKLRKDSRSIAESLLRVVNDSSIRVHGVFDLHEHDTLIRFDYPPSTSPNDLIVTMSCEKLGQRDKIRSIARYKCDRMFGDSDEDVHACLLGNGHCMPYRVLRSPKSTYRGAYNVNLYYEFVVADSMY